MSDTLQWLTYALRPDEAGFWLLLDLLTAAGWWLLLPNLPLRWRSMGRVAGWLLVPWLALMVGALAPQTMGMADVDWQQGLTTGLGIALGVLVLVAAVRYATRTAEPHTQVVAQTAQTDLSAGIGVFAFLYHGAEQFHWCFQRAVVTTLLVTAPLQMETPAYWAIWIASLLALPGVVRVRGVARLYALVALLATAILFFYVRNFWLCWLLHAAIMLLAGAAHARPELQTDSATNK